MTLNRLWAACLLVPAALLFDSSPASASPNGANEPQATAVTRQRLPQGVHRKRDGMYVADVMRGRGMAPRCLAKRLLPSSYVPFVSPIRPPRADALISTPQSGGMGPAQINARYNLSTLPAGTGAIVAIIDSPDYYAASDLAGYRKGYGLPALPTCPASTNGGLPVPGGTPCFASVDENGALYAPTKGQDTPGGSDFEAALDMDMVSAACPACSIVLVQTTGGQSEDAGNGWADIVTAVQSAATLGAASVSISLGFAESTDPLINGAGTTPDPTGYSTKGTLVFAASGDFGYDTETLCGAEDAGCGNATLTTPSYPASAPDVISVGGTLLFNASGAGTYTETVWNDGDPAGQDVTTSGCSSEFAALPWQTANTKLSTTSCTKRASADLSAAAAYATSTTPPVTAAQAINTDIVIYSTSAPTDGINGFSGGIEGTSASSPMVAAIFARLGLPAVMTASMSTGSLGWPYLPANSGGFNDVTVGTDDVDNGGDGGGVSVSGYHFPPQCTGADLLLCQAGPGWDGPTGVGTPNGAKLLALLGGSPVAPDGGPIATEDASVPAGDSGSEPSADGGTNNEIGASSSSSSGCSCTTVGGTNAGGFGAGGLLLGLAALGSRAARRRRSS